MRMSLLPAAIPSSGGWQDERKRSTWDVPLWDGRDNMMHSQASMTLVDTGDSAAHVIEKSEK
jgi:hypothetical protein